MIVFLGNFPATRIDFLLSGKNTGIREGFQKYKYKTEKNFEGETYEGECTKVEENNLLESKK